MYPLLDKEKTMADIRHTIALEVIHDILRTWRNKATRSSLSSYNNPFPHGQDYAGETDTI